MGGTTGHTRQDPHLGAQRPRVRSLRPSHAGGNGQRWKRVRDVLDDVGNIAAHCEIDGTTYSFTREPTLGSERERGWLVRLTVPNRAEASYRALAEVAESAAAEHLIWQASIIRSGIPVGYDLRRVYNTAIGHNRFEPTSTRFLEEPGRLVLIEPELAGHLNPDVVDSRLDRSVVGNLVKLESNNWLPTPEIEQLFDPILRNPPTTLEVPSGLSPSHDWRRKPSA